MVNMTKLCEQNRGLIYMVAKRYSFACMQDRAVDLDDLAQAGYIGLIKAAETFDSSKGAFSSWAVVYILKEMRALLGLTRRDQRADHGAASLDVPLAEDADVTVGSQLPSGEDIEATSDYRDLVLAVRAAVNELPAEQRELVRLHDLEGGSYRFAMKAKNETVEKFQALVADEIIPQFAGTVCIQTVEEQPELRLDVKTGEALCTACHYARHHEKAGHK